MNTVNYSALHATGTLFRDKPVEWLRRIARKLYDWGWYRVSLGCYHLLVKLEPDNDNTWHDRGVIYSDLGRYEKALADYRKALEIYPQHDRAYYNIGEVLWNQNKHAEAVENFQRAIEINDTRGVYWYGLALAQCGLQDTNTALNSIKKAIDLGSDTMSVSISDFEDLYTDLSA